MKRVIFIVIMLFVVLGCERKQDRTAVELQAKRVETQKLVEKCIKPSLLSCEDVMLCYGMCADDNYRYTCPGILIESECQRKLYPYVWKCTGYNSNLMTK